MEQQKNNSLEYIRETVILSEKCKTIFLSTFVWGILAHGFMIFNKFSFHDDAACFFGLDSIDPIVGLGRWMKAILELVRKALYGYDYSLTLINGVVFFLLIAGGLFILSYLLEIENKLVLVCLSGIMVVFPTVTCLFGYIYLAQDYGVGIFLSIAGASLICMNKRWYLTAIGVVCFVCSIGVYQSCFCSGLCVFILFMIKKVRTQKYTWKYFFLEGIKYVLFSVVSIVLYLAVLKIFLKVLDIQMSGYKNLNNMGVVSARAYLKRLINTYGAFFNPNKYVYDYPYQGVSIILYWIILILLIGICILTIIDKARNDKKTAVQLLILFIMFPIAANSIMLLTDACYSMMFYSHVFIYLLFALLAEKYIWHKSIRILEILTVFCLNIVFCNYSNICYLKANLLYENAIGYFNTLITRIQSVEGYSNELPVVYIEPTKKMNSGVPDQLEDIMIIPYQGSSIVNNYAWKEFMRQWCGYGPITLPQIEYQTLDEVRNMPIYPSDGSIQIVGHAIVVKFADPEE